MNIEKYKYLVPFVDLIIIFLYLIIIYLVVYGLIIEPYLPLHFYGPGDVRELLYCFGLGLIISFFYSFKKYIIVCHFYSSKMYGKKMFRFFSLIFLRKNYKKEYYIVLDELFVKNTINPTRIAIVTGITLGGKMKGAYFLGWLYNDELKQINIYKIHIFNGKASEYFIASIPLGEKVKFVFEYLDRNEITLRVYLYTHGKYKLHADNTSNVTVHKFWGIKIHGLENIILEEEYKNLSLKDIL